MVEAAEIAVVLARIYANGAVNVCRAEAVVVPEGAIDVPTVFQCVPLLEHSIVTEPDTAPDAAVTVT
jgi:hypothetical protein